MTGLFDDGKEPDALRTIGEVSRALGIRQHVLRYWEDQFPTLRPIKRSGGRRYYRPEDIALIARIDRLVHKEGYTLRGARQAIAADPGGTKLASASAEGAGRPPQGKDQPTQGQVEAQAGQARLPMLDHAINDRVETLLSGLQSVRQTLAGALQAAG